MEEQKKVIILGSGNSGSGAVYDYLLQRPDFFAPIQKEFRLIQDPGGIIDLHSAIKYGFHVNRASSSIDSFIDLYHRCGRENNKFQLGLNYESFIENYYKILWDLIDKITLVEYKGMAFCERSKLSKFKYYFLKKSQKKAKKSGEKHLYGLTRLPVTEEVFLNEVCEFLNSLFKASKNYDDKKSIVLDQGGTFWKPERSTIYYGKNRKAIVVTRDPRGVFNSFKTRGHAYPGEGVKLFCDWYKQMMKHVDFTEWKGDNVLHVQYEDFVTHYSVEKNKVDDFLGIPSNVTSTIDIDKSAFNAKKFKDRLNKDEMEYIEKELVEYLYF